MAPAQTNLLQGTLDLLILKALALGELHGLGVSQRIEQITRGTFTVGPGSLGAWSAVPSSRGGGVLGGGSDGATSRCWAEAARSADAP